ncbi:MAG: cytochrome c [Aliidongia sp.]
MGKTLLLTTSSLLLLFAAVPLLPTIAHADDPKPYKVENGIVDQGTYNGYRRYGESCLRCHGPDGAGSSYAPNLTDSLKHLSRDQFNEVVINGRQNVTTSNDNVMPAFGTSEDVVQYLDDIYGYLKAAPTAPSAAAGRSGPAMIDACPTITASKAPLPHCGRGGDPRSGRVKVEPLARSMALSRLTLIRLADARHPSTRSARRLLAETERRTFARALPQFRGRAPSPKRFDLHTFTPR